MKYFWILLVSIILIGNVACNSTARDHKKRNRKSEDIVVPVKVEPLKKGPISSYIQSSATLEAEMSVDIVSETSGVVEELYVEEGDSVNRDQTLAVVNFEELKLARDKAETALQEAENTFKRVKNMFDRDLVSREEFDNARFNYNQKKLDFENARVRYEKSMIKAPFAGIITERFITKGQYLALNQKAFSLVNQNVLKVNVFIPEERVALVREGMHADLISEATGNTFSGSVKRISHIVDPATGTVKVTIYVKPEPGLRPGMFVTVRILTDTIPDALLIPKRAVVYQNDRRYVFLYEPDGTARQVELKTGYQNETHFQSTTDQLAEGDRIIIAGQNGLKDGAKVRVTENG